jgi:hypothetical protein
VPKFVQERNQVEENTTQESTVEAPQGQAEAVATEGVQSEVVETPGQEPARADINEAEAETSMFETLKKQKGWTSEEDIAKAYSELEKGFTRKAQDVSQMENLLDALLGDDTEVEPEETYTAPVDRGNRTIAKLEAKDDMRTVADLHSDFYDYTEDMSTILKDAPVPEAFKGPKGVEILYRMAKAEAMERNVAQARSEGRKEVTEKEVAKLQAQVASGTKAKQPEAKIYTREEIGAMPPEVYQANRAEIMEQYSRGLIK